MDTPVVDFVKNYIAKGMVRAHMPGHKGKVLLGPEPMDITEISGADNLAYPEGIIRESEENASRLFESGYSFYSTLGSSLGIKAMLYAGLKAFRDREHENAHFSSNEPDENLQVKSSYRPYIIAVGSMHKSFIDALALLDLDLVRVKDEEGLERLLSTEKLSLFPPIGVFYTSINYLGMGSNGESLARLCHAQGLRLFCDNAHGAYLHFLPSSLHPLDLGADIVVDSAHKTLPVLTGGAYIHTNKDTRGEFDKYIREGLSLFGSSSPSYLIIESLDLCNKILDGDFRDKLKNTIKIIDESKELLREKGFDLLDSDPLRLTIRGEGAKTAKAFRAVGIEPEMLTEDYIVCMFTPYNKKNDIKEAVQILLGRDNIKEIGTTSNDDIIYKGIEDDYNYIGLDLRDPHFPMSIREAYLLPNEEVESHNALGRIVGDSSYIYPPAIPIAIPGERIDEKLIDTFKHYNIDKIKVLKYE